MATQLKDLKFNDYSVKGTVNSNQGADFTLSGSDVFGYMVAGSGDSSSPVFTKIMARDYSTGCSAEWHFYGYADRAGSADTAAAVYTSSGGSALYYDSDSGMWTLNVAAGSAKSVYDSSGGSALYYDSNTDRWTLNVPASYINDDNGNRYDFNGVVYLPELSKSGGSGDATLGDVASWIEQFCQNVSGYLVAATSA